LDLVQAAVIGAACWVVPTVVWALTASKLLLVMAVGGIVLTSWWLL
jgi:hypothetical protein